MALLSYRLAALLAVLAAPAVLGQPYLVRDLLPGPAVSGTSNTVRDLIALPGVAVFVMNHPVVGDELWRLDLSTGKAELLRDIYPGRLGGVAPGPLVKFGNTVLFTTQTPDFGLEPWITDGSTAGTRLLTDLVPGPSSSAPSQYAAMGSIAFFTTSSPAALWKTDGTSAGTVMIRAFTTPPAYLTVGALPAGSRLIFMGNDGVVGSEPWVSDGTVAGTQLLHDVQPGTGASSGGPCIAVGDKVFFPATQAGLGEELWVTDGTPAGTQLTVDLVPGANGAQIGYLTFTAHQGQLYFRANSPSGFELFRADPATLQVTLVRDLYGGSVSSFPDKLRSVGPNLYFFANDVNPSDVKLWRTETDAGVSLVNDFTPGVARDPVVSGTAELGGMLAFVLDDLSGTTGSELWRSDGTAAGTVVVKDIYPGSFGGVTSFVGAAGGQLYLMASDGPHGSELWRTDLTGPGTTMVGDLHVDSASPFLNVAGTVATLTAALFGQQLFFLASKVPWLTDGTSTGTLSITPAGVTGVVVPSLLPFQGRVLVTLQAAGQEEPWISDGTQGGTIQLANINGSSSSYTRFLGAVNGRALFAATDSLGDELWGTDGTGAGTALVKDIVIGTGDSAPQQLATFGSFALFNAAGELWRTDGTGPGTALVTDLTPIAGATSAPDQLTSVGSSIVFAANGALEGRELWRTDGTDAGTRVVVDIGPGALSSSPTGLTSVGDLAFFAASEPDAGIEPWRTDGTTAGTSQIADLVPGAASSSARAFTPLGAARAVFFANTPGVGDEPWVTDGTAAGTTLLRDIQPGPASGGYGQRFYAAGSFAYFVADDGLTGLELWRTDGTTAGTVRVADLAPGAMPSLMVGLTRAGGYLYFVADGNNDAGFELWALAVDSTAPVVTPTVTGTLSADGGWYISDVTVSFAVSELETPASLDTAGCGGGSITSDTAGRSFLCRAASEGGTSSARLQLKRDATPPQLTCPASAGIAATSADGGVATWGAATVLDLDPAAVSLSSTPPSGSLFPLGTTTVTVTGVDPAGNIGQCSFMINVADQGSPLISCPVAPPPTEALGAAGAPVTFGAATATDDTDPNPMVTYSHASGSMFPIGVTHVTATATDNTGKTNTCGFDVVVSDTTPPMLLCPQPRTVEARGMAATAVTYEAATASDTVDPLPSIAYSAPPGSELPVGDTLITLTATDSAGNRSPPCSFTVMVRPGVAPTVQCPARQVLTATSADGANVVYLEATATDDFDPMPMLAYNVPRGAAFAVGTTEVQVTASDSAGNEAQCSFEVQVDACRSRACTDSVYSFGCSASGPGSMLVLLVALMLRRRR